MKTKRIRRKKRIIAIVILTMLLNLLCFAVVFAYSMHRDRIVNTFTVGNNIIEVDEKFDPPKVLTPGSVIRKEVCVRNTGKNSCFVRVYAAFADERVNDFVRVDYNLEDWERRADGYFYYRYSLPAGEKTTLLFSNITVDSDAPEHSLTGFEMIVYAESRNEESGGFER